MINIVDKKDCCGCTACFNICPRKCISMVEDENGFLYPNVDKTKCIDCKLCEKICPMKSNNDYESNVIKAYAVKNNTIIREKESSGGFFSILAEYILSNNGYVVGASYNEDFSKVEHVIINNLKDLYKLYGSKYVQSSQGNTFTNIKELLDRGNKILYSGTPCQIAGLKKYLNKEYENLLTVDIICHGTPSNKMFKKYIDEQIKKHNSELKELNFVSKINGWHSRNVLIKFKNGKIYNASQLKDPYMHLYINDFLSRTSCAKCKFKDNDFCSDITLGDFWGVEKLFPEFDDNKGISSVIIRNKKGNDFFNQLKNNKINFIEIDYNLLKLNNKALVTPFKENESKEEFIKDIWKISYEELEKKYNKESFIKRVLRRFKKVLVK